MLKKYTTLLSIFSITLLLIVSICFISAQEYEEYELVNTTTDITSSNVFQYSFVVEKKGTVIHCSVEVINPPSIGVDIYLDDPHGLAAEEHHDVIQGGFFYTVEETGQYTLIVGTDSIYTITVHIELSISIPKSTGLPSYITIIAFLVGVVIAIAIILIAYQKIGKKSDSKKTEST